jgi:hypothetical protein
MTITDYIEEAYAPKVALTDIEGEARVYSFRELTPTLLKSSVNISFSTKRMRERTEDGFNQAQALSLAIPNIRLTGGEGEIVLVSESPVDVISRFIELIESRGELPSA